MKELPEMLLLEINNQDKAVFIFVIWELQKLYIAAVFLYFSIV